MMIAPRTAFPPGMNSLLVMASNEYVLDARPNLDDDENARK